MFLPVEGLYAEAIQTPDLVETLQREERVVLAGPGTFSAMLNALQLGFRTMAIEKRSDEVWHLLGEIKTDFARFAEMLEATRHRLEQAGESIDSAVSRTRTIRRKLSGLENLPEDTECPEPFLQNEDPEP
jgi:DNA recombination protein RmuC